MALTKSRCLRVQFFEPVDGKTDYYFGSIKAIYERFKATEIGLSMLSLYSRRISEVMPVVTRKCLISRIEILRNGRQSRRGD
jgi:hypothetical protein